MIIVIGTRGIEAIGGISKLSFYLKVNVQVVDYPDVKGGGKAGKRGDIKSVHAFDVWEERSLGGKKARKTALIYYMEMPDSARESVHRFMAKRLAGDVWDDILIDGVGLEITEKRRVSVLPDMLVVKFPPIHDAVNWQRVENPEDDYQPLRDVLFALKTNQADFFYDKNKARLMTQKDFDDDLTSISSESL